ncbi:hypothetical protein [Microvirga subterranea]|uniref:Uncharacterized protein n=1 Tax=Microvirga subterranea TaxID=186651 RepID=A0A370HV22_9HYPH|nr:hypothetical protein [Microvirga subterranea]RDI60774.1 hypothetical protein DES45_102162 [Microvirga subterranea]
MSSTRDVPANPIRTMKATASRPERRPRKATRRTKRSERNAIPPSQERFDQAVNSIRQLAEDMSQSAQDELAHILASEIEDNLSFIMDAVEPDKPNLLANSSKEQPSSSFQLKPADGDAQPFASKPQYGGADRPASVRRRAWVGSLLVAAQVSAVAALLVSLVPPLLSSRQEHAESRRMEASSATIEKQSAASFGSSASTSRAARTVEFEVSSSNVQAERSRTSGTLHSPAIDQDARLEEKPRPTERLILPTSIATETAGKQVPEIRPQIAPGNREPPADAQQNAEQQLLNRAQALLQNRDISGARLVLEKAVSLGSAKAASQLAETFDPSILDRWQVRGITGDQSKSQELHKLARILELRASGVASANR